MIGPLMPRVLGRSRPWRDHRQVVEGIVYRYRTGVAWRDLPARFGPWQTVWKRHARSSRDGTWDRVLTTLQARADARGDVNWQVSVDSTVNRAHQHAATLLRNTGAGSNHKNQKWSEPDDHALGRSHSSRAIRTELRRRGIVSVIPEPRDQQAHRKRRGPKGGRPVSYDVEVYKGRNVVERFLNYLKQWRGLATRYDKYAHIYLGGVTLGAILCWLSSQC